MMIERLVLSYRCVVAETVLQGGIFNAQALPSFREAGIQIAKYKRMYQAFDKKFPLGMEMTAAKRKVMGRQKRDLYQQCKVLDRLVQRLIEERISDEASIVGAEIAPKKARAAAQKLVEKFNGELYSRIQERAKGILTS